MQILMDDEFGVITGKNGFLIIIKGTLYGTFPYSMKNKIMSLFERDK